MHAFRLKIGFHFVVKAQQMANMGEKVFFGFRMFTMAKASSRFKCDSWGLMRKAFSTNTSNPSVSAFRNPRLF